MKMSLRQPTRRQPRPISDTPCARRTSSPAARDGRAWTPSLDSTRWVMRTSGTESNGCRKASSRKQVFRFIYISVHGRNPGRPKTGRVSRQFKSSSGFSSKSTSKPSSHPSSSRTTSQATSQPYRFGGYVFESKEGGCCSRSLVFWFRCRHQAVERGGTTEERKTRSPLTCRRLTISRAVWRCFEPGRRGICNQSSVSETDTHLQRWGKICYAFAAVSACSDICRYSIGTIVIVSM